MERPGILHNAVAHPLLAMPRPLRWLGWWIHDHTSPMVTTWRTRCASFLADERYGRR